MSFLKKYLSHPYHFILLILFFLFNGWRQNRGLIPVSDLVILTIYLLLTGGVIYFLFRRIFRSSFKAGLFTTLLLIIGLFFGVIKDLLSGIPSLARYSRMNFMLLATLVIVVGLFLLIKKSREPGKGIHFFFNLLFLIYILFDFSKAPFLDKVDNYALSNPFAAIPELVRCDTCKNPDIFLVVADEYMGIKGLRDFFKYDDSAFIQFLRKKEFHIVPDPYSNYFFTVFSMSSLLNMQYPPGLGPQRSDNPYGYQQSIKGIRDNLFCRYLIRQGYRLRNYSVFDLGSETTPYNNALVPLRSELLTDKTIYNRVMKSIPHVLSSTFKWEWLINRITETNIKNNEGMLEESIPVMDSINNTPTFTYVHLSMPHEPYAFDRYGHKRNLALKLSREEENAAYLEYLIYTNGRLETYISKLIESTEGKAIILLLSDHGYRGSGGNPISKNPLSVLNAIYLPTKNYNGWYDSISHVNHLRVLLNTQFGQRLPMLKDSVVK